MEGREAIYEELTLALKPIADRLDEYGKTDLDGILWVEAHRIAEGIERRAKFIAAVIPFGTHVEAAKPMKCWDGAHFFGGGSGPCVCGKFPGFSGFTCAAIKVFEHA